MLQRIWISLALALVTAGVYAPVRGHEFVLLDDLRVMVHNPALEFDGPVDALGKAFSTTTAANWLPVTLISLQVDRALWKGDPAGSFLGNVALHVAATLLLFLALQRLTGALWPCAFVAAVFALHPLHVESVAWASMRKDALSGLFFMLALWSYAGYAERPGRLRYAAVTLWLILGLLSKPTVVTLPFVLLLLDWWPLERLRCAETRRAAVVEKLPWVALAAGAGVATWLVQDQWEAISDLVALPLDQRLANAIESWRLYIEKSFWPADLAVYYPHPRASLGWGRVAMSGALLATVSGVSLSLARTRPYLIVGWLWYLGMLLPMIGIVQVGDQAMADRYSYLPLIGLSIAVAWGLTDLFGGRAAGRVGLALAGAASVLAMSGATAAQLEHWRNEIVLETRAVAISPHDSRSRHRLAAALQRAGRFDEATVQIEHALELAPQHGWAHAELADLLARGNQLDRAIDRYQHAIALSPNLDRAHVNLGLALARLDRLEEARLHLERGMALHADGRRHSDLPPERLAAPHLALADALVAAGELDAAIAHYKSAFALDPSRTRAGANLGLALAEANRFEEAQPLLEDSLTINYRSEQDQAGLARTYASLGRKQDAVRHFRNALLLRPGWRHATNDLAWILATSPNPDLRDPEEAVALMENVLLEKEYHAAMLDTLGAAYAAAGRTDDAVRAADRALALARRDPALAAAIRERRTLYLDGTPFTEVDNGNGAAKAPSAVR